MIRSVITAEFAADVETVWNIVTDNRDTSWRSDLKCVRIYKEGKEFAEYPRHGAPTFFSITRCEPMTRYEFNLENKLLMGFWSGHFSPLPQGGTRIVFAENIRIKNRLLRAVLSPFLNPRKIQEAYIRDLRRRLGEAEAGS